jgi:PIN domain nuclease of toxin-antitoxin system
VTEALLLDTHVWIWLALGSGRLSLRAQQQIRPFVNRDVVYISAITLFEVAYSVQRKRIELPTPRDTWFADIFRGPSPHVVPITTEISVASTQLPPAFHGGPADRLIAATARTHNLTLCTHDGHILRHSQAGLYQTLEV